MTDAPSRIKSVRFAGLRTATSVELDLTGLTVLIGPNGVGKSTLIEGLELLRKIATGDDFLRALHDDHRGPASLLTHGASDLSLGIDVEIQGEALGYELVLSRSNGGFAIAKETLTKDGVPRFDRDGNKVTWGPPGVVNTAFRDRQPLLSVRADEFAGIVALLEGIDVHSPFTTQAGWVSRERGKDAGTRSDNIVQATARLARTGINLPNALHTLRNRADWQDTLETIRVVVDEDIVDVVTPAYVSGGSIGLEVRYRTGSVPSFALSDGTLGLLALVVVATLDEGEPRRSILVLDEPDLHLHPSAIPHVVSLLEGCAETCPVVVATHSDHLLDCLADPAQSTVLCDLDEHRRLRLRRPQPDQLKKWLLEYRGVGRILAEGYASFVFPRPSRVADKS